ncbi:MAG TPA: carbohydrate kinase [Clostridiaceae bacterium]|nr:carbohydrate kinase [Clostridiaceae bacterium]
MGQERECKSKFTVVGVGEILWDMLPSGKELGGAVTNFAYHAFALGADAYVVSAVGDDELGREIIAKVDELGLSTRYIQLDAKHPTGTVDVTLDANGIPSYVIHENVAWDYIKFTKEAFDLAKKADAICFGSLAQRSQTSRNTIISFLENSCNENNDRCLRVFDINLRQNFYNREIIHQSLQYANALKLNDEELKVIDELLGLSESLGLSKDLNVKTTGLSENMSPFIHDILNHLAEKYSLDLIVLTRGDKGSILFSKGQFSEHSGFRVEVADTVGAGDAFTAAVVMGYLHCLDLDQISNIANKLASYVCSQKGGTPNLPDELKRLL